MAYTPKEGSGSLFKNDRKTTENHPDYSGTIMVNGKEHWLSAWVKEGKKGKFFSGVLRWKSILVETFDGE